MNKGAIVCAFALAVAFVTPDVGAQQLTTDFVFHSTIGGVRYTNEVTKPGYHMMLPASFSRWECLITSAFYSSDGMEMYHNISCSSLTDDAVVGVTISCPTRTEGSDTASFFLRSNDSDVGFSGYCHTHAVNNRQPATPSTKL